PGHLVVAEERWSNFYSGVPLVDDACVSSIWSTKYDAPDGGRCRSSRSLLPVSTKAVSQCSRMSCSTTRGLRLLQFFVHYDTHLYLKWICCATRILVRVSVR
ncbi:unnamed protein product, partial [Ectocarpus sp. 6 AP-2014]